MTERITPEDLNRFLLNDSDDENLEMISLEYKKYRLSTQDKKTKANKRKIIHRNRLEDHRRIIKDYFSKTKYSHTSKMFRRRFRMSEDLFTSIVMFG
jgi:ABC-type ATPase with predicted acetyltransferase domain